MILGVLKEAEPERRVSILPEHVKKLMDLGYSEVWMETSAGKASFQEDSNYSDAGASIKSRKDILADAQVILCIQTPNQSEISPEKILITQMNPLSNPQTAQDFAKKGVSVFSMDMVPRTTKAQAMDVLSSMATSAGYKAVLQAAIHLPKFFPMFMTAAGTIIPAKVLILGAGVAGLQAISTAKRLGAVVEAFDVRAAAKEEVLSLGAKFVEVEGATDDTSAGGYAVEQTEEYKQRQAALIQEHAAKSDVIICTAQIPGRKAPLLIQEETLHKMKAGSVVVDLAASSGGNCAFSKNNETVVVNGVSIIGDSSLASSIPLDSSKMYGKNLINFFKEVINDGAISFDFENEIIQHTCVSHGGAIISPRVLDKFSSVAS
ncbi:MAG: Re/Si-specific NAD(P)(+) transhydrogenase subunit alpha [Bacteroidia bacterium]|nr:Re/Si-specific NAD(P)(+) transhydrogenase subunit alpha [Bacteroidia bacterium]